MATSDKALFFEDVQYLNRNGFGQNEMSFCKL